MPRAAITRVASYLPEGQLTNEMLVEEFGGWTAERIESKTGIRVRHRAAPDEFSSDMAIRAARNLFACEGVSPEGLDLLMLVTICPDQGAPFTASTIQHQLGLPQQVGALDITLACSGYPYALTLAAGLIESGRARKIMVLTSDRFTPFTEEAEMGSKTLFGDGASATMVEAVSEGALRGGVIGLTRYGTDGSGVEQLIVPTSGLKGFVGARVQTTTKPTLVMDGPAVFAFALKTVSKFVQDFLVEAELRVEQVDHFIFHQANLFMLEALRKKLKIPEERFVVHLAEVGNTNSSTIPIALASLQDRGQLKSGQTVVLVGFGTGYSWSAARIDFA
jgi:3-oxoacyl-[acyl-carrier-protein] synthase III